MMDPIVVTGLTKCFGSLAAVDGVSMTLLDGEVLGLVGPNGAGKTTLLDLLCGHLKPDHGQIFLLGSDAVGKPSEKLAARGLARTFQHPRVVYELTTLHNAMLACPNRSGERWLPALWRPWWREEELSIERRSREVLGRLELGGCLDMNASDLSFGQVKLLTLAMTLVTRAPVVALDEPVAGIAPQLREVIARVILETKGERSYLVIEHDMDFLKQVADRVLLMDRGRVVLHGPPEEVLSSPEALKVYMGRSGDHG